MASELPNTLPSGTRYTVNGSEYELLGPSTMREDGSYPAVARRCLTTGVEHEAPKECIADYQSLALEGAMVVLPEAEKVDPYAEHRRRIGDDK